MSEFGKIHRKFWDHRKAKQAGNAALGLWAKANSWCRDNRSAGYVPREVALELGTFDEVGALLSANLWVKVFNGGGVIGFRFKDYEVWNDDVEPDTEAGNLVRAVVPESHPSAIRKQLSKQAAALLAEGIGPEVVEAALKLWLSKNLSPALLPSLASEAMKDAQRSATLRNAIDQCIKSNAVSPLKPYGYIFTPPDPPDGLGVEQRRAFMAQAKRNWLNDLRGKVAA